MIHVVCLKWGDKYGVEYVNRLYAMVEKNLSIPFVFHCLTENSQGIRSEVMIESLPDEGLHTWWYKLLIFKKGFLGLSNQDKILFLDLDIVILNSLDTLVSYSDDFCISADTTVHKYNSSVMCFFCNQYSYIWESFIAQKDHVMNSYHGDQDWIEHVYQQAIIYPKTLVKSFKIDLNSKTPFSFGPLGRYLRKKMPFLLPKGQVEAPTDASIVLFHGKPDPVDVMNGPYDKYKYAPWIKDTWL
ncbi:hypothetical protein [Thiomicrorhabdus sp. Milos-T2]|uniref:hypothetical protein n=1 Tax=Thiomicrorhabdus sp. Milos-T2 TaxID=90814 RepID=UPI0004948299|nr:hypothetical protein [Thiomicrorhabdus sp. Milos-T2]